MKIKYFQDTDTLYIEFRPVGVAETKDLAENIAYGGQYDIDSIIQISKKLGIDDFIRSTPNQYNTVVGHSGLELSSFEKQQICTARALLKNATIMLFDETSIYLDDQSTKTFFDVLAEIKKDKIIVLTSTNPLNHKSIDRILFLENGILKEEI